MKYLKKINLHVIVLIFIALCIVFTYWNLPNTFFQQDEWQGLAEIIYYQSIGVTGIINYFFPPDAISHFNPFGAVFALVESLLLYTDFTPYAWLSIILHVVNAFLLYYFVLIFLKSRKIATISALVFSVNSVSSQAVTWVAAANSYEIPTAFILLSLIFLHRFLLQKEHRRRNIILSLTMLFISLLFHENGIFLFLFYPIIFFLYVRSEWKKLLPTFSYGIVLFMLAYVFMRIPFFFGFSSSLPAVTDISRPPITVYPYRLITLGMKSFVGSFFPEKTLIGISEEVVRLAYPQFLTSDNVPNPYISQSIVFDLTSYALSVAIVCIVLLFVRFMPEKNIKRALIWTLLFIPMSIIPYGFVLGKAGYASILEPKFFYVGSIGVSIIIGIIVYSLLQKFSKQKILKITVYLMFGLYVLNHIYGIRSYVNNFAEISIQRKTFLTAIKSSYQNLPQKVIFFTQSDTSYYGMPDNEKILPVQVGFGEMLMIWYQKDERFPGCLYEGHLLLGLLEEDYRYCEGRGFGYFRNYDKLIDAVKNNSLNPENVIAYSWNGNTKEFKDITEEIKQKLVRDTR